MWEGSHRVSGVTDSPTDKRTVPIRLEYHDPKDLFGSLFSLGIMPKLRPEFEKQPITLSHVPQPLLCFLRDIIDHILMNNPCAHSSGR
jgi:hypothetical protein